MSLTRSLLNDFLPLSRLIEGPFFAATFTRVQPTVRRPPVARPSMVRRHMPIELYEEGRNVVVRVEVPGAQKRLDIDLGKDGQSLTIRGRMNKPEETSQLVESNVGASLNSGSNTVKSVSETLSRPRSRSSFSRTIWLPQVVKGKEACAELADGILTLRIPKLEETVGECASID